MLIRMRDVEIHSINEEIDIEKNLVETLYEKL